MRFELSFIQERLHLVEAGVGNRWIPVVQQMTVESRGSKEAREKVPTKEAVNWTMEFLGKIRVTTSRGGTMFEDLASACEEWKNKNNGDKPDERSRVGMEQQSGGNKCGMNYDSSEYWNKAYRLCANLNGLRLSGRPFAEKIASDDGH